MLVGGVCVSAEGQGETDPSAALSWDFISVKWMFLGVQVSLCNPAVASCSVSRNNGFVNFTSLGKFLSINVFKYCF